MNIRNLFLILGFVFTATTIHAQSYLFCDEQPSDSFFSFAKSYTSKYMSIDCWASRKIEETPTLESDKKFCECLQKNDINFKFLDLIKPLPAPETLGSEELQKKMQDEAKQTSIQYGQEQDGFAFEAFFFNKGDKKTTQDILDFTPAFSSEMASKKELERNLIQECKGNLCKYYPKVKEDVASGLLKETVSSFEVPRAKAEQFSNSINITDKQCLSPKTFFELRQLPKGKITNYLNEKALENFSSKDWNYIELEKEYDHIISKASDDRSKNDRKKIIEIKEKLRFLNKNQILKTFLAANPDLPDSSSEDLIKAWEPTKTTIEKRKKDLFQLVVEASKAQGDSLQMFQPQTFKNYQDGLKNFFEKDNKENLNLLMSENDRQRDYRATTNFRRRMKPTPPTRNSMIYKYMSQEDSAGDPTECSGEWIDSVKCQKIFSGYCKSLSLVDISKSSEADPDFADDLFATLENDYNPDMKSNPEFRRWNDQLCNTKFLKTSVDTTPPQTFFEYLSKKCPDCANNPEKIAEYHNQFLKEYTWPLRYNGSFTKDEINSLHRAKPGSITSNVTTSFVRDEKRARGSKGLFSEFSSPKESPLERTSKLEPQENQLLPASDLRTASEQSNYLSPQNFRPTSAQAASADKAFESSIEDMSNDEKKRYLSKLEREYEKKLSDLNRSNSEDNKSDVALKEIQALRTEIETWKALLAQQQSITAQQMKMLNDSMNARAKQEAADQERSASAKKKSRARESSVFSAPLKSNASSRENAEEPSRSTSAAMDSNSSSDISGSQSSSVSSRSSTTARSSSSAPAASSSDSIAREQAKLNGQVGTLMIETPKGQGPEVFSLPVSSEQYQNLKADPTKVSLDPKQIELLNKRGVITIIVGAVGKPPLELKVEKVDNKIVYNLKENDGPRRAPASRVFTREALELQFQTPR